MNLQQVLVRLGSRILQPVHSSTCITDSMYRYCHTESPESPPTTRATSLENQSLLKNLTVLGVDVMMARRRQPTILQKVETNECGLADFLYSKGASREVVGSIISRFPRAITRSAEHLDQRWKLWRNIFTSNAKIIKILHRSPESFFRSTDNENLEKNVAFLSSLDLTPKHLQRLVTVAPRTFSNSVELNRTMVELLHSICVSLGGKDCEGFAKAIISRNVYILTRSTKRVKANIHFLLEELKLSDDEALVLLQGPGAEILDLSHPTLKNNFLNLQEKLQSLGCQRADVKKLVFSYSTVLFLSSATLNNKLDCLVEGGVDIKQIVNKPKVLDFSVATLKHRLDVLNSLSYNFGVNGVSILDMSKKRFDTKLKKLQMFEE